MPEMTSPTDFLLRSKAGQSVEFVTGAATYVSPQMAAEAEALGAILSGADAVAEPAVEPVAE